MQEKITIKKIKQIIREGYAWPGGYELFLISDDGQMICIDCAKKNFREIVWSTKNKVNDGWNIISYCYEAVPADCMKDNPQLEELISYCAQCNKEIGECS